MFTLVVPPAYGWVVLGAGIGPWITSMYLSAAVMKGRTEYNVQYPNCYAIPGYHKNADEFNRIQRSHQNYLEGLDQYIVMTVLGGLKYPIACAIGCTYIITLWDVLFGQWRCCLDMTLHLTNLLLSFPFCSHSLFRGLHSLPKGIHGQFARRQRCTIQKRRHYQMDWIFH